MYHYFLHRDLLMLSYYVSVLPKPLFMELVLAGQAMSLESLNVTGIYHLQEKLVNSYPHWNQQDGENSIWFGKESQYYPIQIQRRWSLGPKELLGGIDGYIIGPKGIDQPPTRIIKGWEYFNNEGKVAADSEITFRDLSPSKQLD